MGTSKVLLNTHLNQGYIDKQYQYWRLHVFIGIYIGYVAYYITRKSFTYVTPALIQDLGFDKADIGLIGTLFYFIYGLSKFVSGLLSDHANPRYFMAIGLFITGVLNILLGLSASLIVFAAIWSISAFFQGWGWPPCSKVLNCWYSRTERGFWWGLWNTTQSVGGTIAPVFLGWLVMILSWQYGLGAAGLLAILVSFFIVYRVRDKPETMGLPTVGQWRNDQQEIAHEQEGLGLSNKEILLQYVLNNKMLWLLGLAYILVFIVKTAISDWGNLYLIETHGYSLLEANSALSASEIGGLIGCLVAGWGSDWWFQGNRGPMNSIFAIGVCIAVFGLWMIPDAGFIAQIALFFIFGFFIYGPHMLIGIAAIECSHKSAAGASNGFVSLFAYVGAAISGYPVALIMESYGWNGFFVTLATCSVIVIALFIPFIVSRGKFGFTRST
ncbi:MFS transporter family glucose-6-phosphate receptor UhpC [Spongorhabdus nitratireducens]